MKLVLYIMAGVRKRLGLDGDPERKPPLAITDFLKTKRSEKDLTIALDVLREFKAGENSEEWMELPFAAWAKLEQLEEFLDHLVNGTDLEADTIAYIERLSTGDSE